MKEVRFGLIGLGAMGMAHAKTLLGDVPNAQLCAAATASQTHAAELLALPGAEDVRVFATPAEMYQSGLIDAVLIATPHRLHVRQAVEAFRAGEIDALVTAPVCKQCIHSDEFAMGHTEYLQKQFGGEGDRALMILFNDLMRVAVATTHLPIKDVPAAITKDLVLNKIEDFGKALTQDFGIDGPKIAVLSLNPHAGDGGLLGTEEQEQIAPAIKEAEAKGILAFGPFAADGLFGSGAWRRFDGILAMYHDQGLAPFKLMAGDDAVNFTAGLPVVRTSPDFGTAFDIAGAGKADASGMRTAIYAAVDLLRTRKRHLKAAANPLRKHYVERGTDKSVDLSKED